MTKNLHIIDWCERLNAGDDIETIVIEIGKECDRLKNQRETIGNQTIILIVNYSTLVGMIVMHELAKQHCPGWNFKFSPVFFP